MHGLCPTHLLRHVRKCHEYSDLGRDFHLCSRGYHQKTTQALAESLLGSTDFEHHSLRENDAFAGTYSYGYQRTKHPF